MLHDETETHIHQLAVQIADDAARADIETWCQSFTSDGREPVTAEEIRSAWYDISMVDGEAARIIQMAVSYLVLRGMIVRYPSKKNWVRLATG
jgi:hypothetical protein